MKCDKIQKEIIKGHGVAIPADSAEHISKCQKCTAFLDDYKKISKLKPSQSAPSSVLDETILNFAIEHKKEKHFSALKFLVPFIAAAACFILLFVIFMNMNEGKKTPTKETFTMNNLPEPVSIPKTSPIKTTSQNSKTETIAKTEILTKKLTVKELAQIESELIEIAQVLEDSNHDINNELEEFSSQIFTMELELN